MVFKLAAVILTLGNFSFDSLDNRDMGDKVTFFPGRRKLEGTFGTVETPVSLTIGTLNYSVYLPESPDSLIEDYLGANPSVFDVGEEKIPYWAELWPSAIALGEFLLNHPEIITGKRVLEIGAGLGIPSLVAGSLNPASVDITDYLPEPLDYARLSWDLNHPDQKANIYKYDWRESLPGTFDVLLASDVAYERAAFPALLKCIDSMRGTGAVLVVSEPSRHLAGEFREALMKRPGFQGSEIYEVFRNGLRTKVFVCSILL
jgi:predicted nicotinamide N-methyase